MVRFTGFVFTASFEICTNNSSLRDSRKKQSLEIITDDRQIYERVMNYLESFQPEDKEKLRICPQNKTIFFIFIRF